MTVRVKVCGNTRLEDALAAAAAGADALGFIFWPPSPRAADPETVAAIVRELPSYVVTVGVFVDAPVAEMNAVVERCRLDRIQLHGHEPYAMIEQLARPAYRARKLADAAALEALLAEPDAEVLLDTPDAALPGGTGRTGNWALARRAGEHKRVILAGGLGADNVLRAIETARPWAVDVSSSLESRPGIKDPDKIAAFFDALKGGAPPQPESNEHHASAS